LGAYKAGSDPKLPVEFSQSGQMLSDGFPVFRFYEAVVRGLVQSATTRRSGLLSNFNGSGVVRLWRMAAIRRAN
jgi:hypothetical protein